MATGGYAALGGSLSGSLGGSMGLGGMQNMRAQFNNAMLANGIDSFYNPGQQYGVRVTWAHCGDRKSFLSRPSERGGFYDKHDPKDVVLRMTKEEALAHALMETRFNSNVGKFEVVKYIHIYTPPTVRQVRRVPVSQAEKYAIGMEFNGCEQFATVRLQRHGFSSPDLADAYLYDEYSDVIAAFEQYGIDKYLLGEPNNGRSAITGNELYFVGVVETPEVPRSVDVGVEVVA